MTEVIADDLGLRTLTRMLRRLRPVCVLACVASVGAVVLAIVLGARTALEIAAVLMLVGLLSTVACNITRG